MAIGDKRRDRRQAEIDELVNKRVHEEIEKAMSPAVAMAAQMSSGATYAVPQVNTSSPFNQVGPGQGFQPLPRPSGVFDSGFGPANPLFPDAIDPLTPSGRTLARRTEYLIAANVNLIDRRVPWSVLKGLAEDVDIIQRCIQIVQDAIVGLEWSWGFSPQIIQQIMSEEGLTNSSKASAVAKDKYGDELARVQAFFDYPDKRMGFTFSQWLTDIIYSHLVYDGIVVAPEYTLDGELSSLSTIDTSTIKILLDNQGFIPRPPSPAFQQILYGFPRGEFQAENVEQDGSIPDAYSQDQLAYYIRRPRPSSIYGYSQVEECINIATIYMERQAWLHAEYTNGVTPRMVVTTDATETWTPEQLAYYERIYNEQFSGQTQRRHNFMLMRPGMKTEQLKSVDEAYKNQYDEWLVMQIGAKFGVPMNMLGIKGPASLGGGHEKGQSDMNTQYATDALKEFLIDCINDLARRFMGVGPELTITATGGGTDSDDLTRAQADQIDVSSGIRTRNEVRAERGIPLMDETEADQLGVTIGTGVSFLAGTLAAQHSSSVSATPPGAPSAKPTEAGAQDGQRPESGGSAASVAATPESGPTGGGSSTSSPGDSKTPSVTPKDDTRQPEVEKELAQFVKFAKARIDRHRWRDFEFKIIPPERGQALNKAGRVHSMAAVMHELAKDGQAGNAEALAQWYEDGAEGQIDWGTPGDFDACVAIAGQYVDDPEGYCNLRHQGATGGAPGTEGKKAAGSTYTPPEGVQEEAQRAVEWIKDGHAGGGFTAVGRGRAGDLAAGRPISLTTIKRMASFLARHEVDKRGKGWSPGEDGYPSPGRVAWAAWGGDPAVAWTGSIVAQEDAKKASGAGDTLETGEANGGPGRGLGKADGDTAFITQTGYVRLPMPLQAGDQIVVQHRDKTKDSYPLEDPDDVAAGLDQFSPSDIDEKELEAAKAIVSDMIAPDIKRLSETHALLNRLRSRFGGTKED